MIKRIFLFLLTNILVIALVSVILMILTQVFGISIGGVFNGSNYTSLAIYAGVVGFSGSFISLWMSKWIAKMSYGVEVVNYENISSFPEKMRGVYQTIENLSQNLGITMPEVGIYLSSEANAFATGPSKNNSLVAVSTGLLEVMTPDEIEGVIAHEMAHVANGDMVTMTLLQGIMNTLVIFISRILASIIEKFIQQNNDEESESAPSSGTWVYFVVSMVLEIIFGILASIVIMSFSRYREYRADEGSADLVGKEKMIAALKKLQRLYDSIEPQENDTLATMKISSKSKLNMFELFSSHPSLDKRIENLQSR